METTTYSVPDIVCGGCANAITKALKGQTGISDVSVDVDAKRVTVSHEASQSRETIAAALERAGFPADAL